MRKIVFGLSSMFICLFLNISWAQSNEQDEVFLYSYFKGNGEGGLHLAYSWDGYHWTALNEDRSFLKPTAGGDKLMRDPCIIRGRDGKFHMVWTVSWNEKGIGYSSSEDLIHWSEQKFIPVMAHENAARNCWAPEVFYDETGDKYMIFWSSTIEGRFPETQSSEESGYNHRIYYVTTKDFQTFSRTGLLYEPGFNVIDGTLMKINGQYTLFLKDETRTPPEKNIRIATSKALTGPYSAASAPITGDYWAEGPSVAKVDNLWIVYFDKYIDHKMGAVASADLEQWKDISEKIHFPEGTRHGTVFKVSREALEQLKNF